MKTRAMTILLGTVLALGAASPSWAQGSEERDDNGGGHPGRAIGPYYYSYQGAYPRMKSRAKALEPRRHGLNNGRRRIY